MRENMRWEEAEGARTNASLDRNKTEASGISQPENVNFQYDKNNKINTYYDDYNENNDYDVLIYGA